jgi:quercetin dioxygenase-like cupin family protein
MSDITVVAEFELNTEIAAEKDKETRVIFDGARRQLIEIKLKNGAVLAKHKAKEPITVLCLAGEGVFHAGKDLTRAQNLKSGILITLEPEIEHEVVARPEIHILVTKFKQE